MAFAKRKIALIVVDPFGWIEFFVDGPRTTEFATRLRNPSNIISPTVAIYEVYKWVKRERSRTTHSTPWPR